jgi:pimeloyl-ACP methyl ester carboxylesterase
MAKMAVGSWATKLCVNKLDNVKRIRKLKFPCTIIHGEQDEIVPFCHGKTLYESCTGSCMLVKIINKGHNIDMKLIVKYYLAKTE